MNPGPGSPPPVGGTPGAAGLPANGTDPGRVALRRLNRTEYNNTVRDLLGSKLRPADAFVADLAGHGFDNNGDVQALNTTQIEQYENAAHALVDEALAGGAGRIAAAGGTQACNHVAEGIPCIRKLVSAFARRAWRRPPAPDEIDRVMRIAEGARTRGEDATLQLRLTLAGVLTSPHFLFRAEIDPDPAAARPRPLNDHEVASRLSYLLYSSMPDEALFAAADGGRLRSEGDITAQVTRMLADPKATAFVERFAGQWLDIATIAEHEADPEIFGRSFDRALAEAMHAETLRFFSEFLQANLPVSELLTARFTFVNARLAQHYGLPAGGAELARVMLSGPQRGGLLTQGSILTATSSPDETNPVARGNWVLSQLLCTPPPAAPGNVPTLPAQPTGTTLRELFEAHRADPVCASCHIEMDAIGFGLENFDAIGRWRTMDNGDVINAAGELEGDKFNGPLELGTLLAKSPRFAACVGSKLFSYAVGRLPSESASDRAYVDRMVALASPGGRMTLKALVLALVTSDPFRLRRGEPAEIPGGRP